MQTNNNIQKNRVYAPIMLWIALLLMVFVLYPKYTSYMDTNIKISSLEQSLSEKQTKIDEIKKMQALFAGTGSNDIKSKVQKYNQKFDSSNIMEAFMLNKYTESSFLSPASIKIGNIAIDKWRKLPNGLSLASVSLTVTADNADQVIDYITYMTTESSLAVTIDNIALPLDTLQKPQDATTSLSLSLSLGVYYYE